MSEWLYDNLGKVLLGLMALTVLLCVVLLVGDANARAAFMAECLTERKQYECTAMWRAGNSNTVIVPVVR